MKKLLLITAMLTSLVQGAEVWLPNVVHHSKLCNMDANDWRCFPVRSYEILPGPVIKAVTTDDRLLISDRFVVVDKAPKPEPGKKETPGSSAISGKPAEK